MAGEGLGRHTTPQQRKQLASRFQDHDYDVIGIGDILIDYVIDRDHPVLQEYTDADWYPAPGDTVLTDDLPTPVQDAAHASYPGGRAANQTVAAAHAGSRSALIGTGSTDISTYLEGAGVDTAWTLLDDRDPTEVYVVRGRDGDNGVIATQGDRMTHGYVADTLTNDVAAADYVLMNNGEPDAALHAALHRIDQMDDGPAVIFDPAPADNVDAVLDYDCVDYLTPNAAEYDALKDAVADWPGTVIRTSADSVIVENMIADHDQEIPVPELDRVDGYDVVDTTAAGDVFNGYLAAELADGAPLEDAVVQATYAATLSVTRHGAQPSIPTSDEVVDFMQDVVHDTAGDQQLT